MRRSIASFVIFSFVTIAADAAAQHAITSVRVDRSTLNVAAGDSVTVTVDFATPGSASVIVVDRDGYLARTLASREPVRGSASFLWNGRDDEGRFVADEAYSFRVEWHGRNNEKDVYNPGESPAAVSAIAASSYDRRTATLTYTLPRPSRVHIQAGTALADPGTGKLAGPVMKTVVNREPRVTGSIAEQWNGRDESGTIFIPDLDHFAVAIAASPLPENSVVTFGNRARRFVDTLPTRHGTSFFKQPGHHEHHAGLRTEDDVSPPLKIEPLNAIWSPREHAWLFAGATIRARISVEGPTSTAFRRHPATLETFIDGRRVQQSRVRTDVVEIPIGPSHGTRLVSINWSSDWGPVAANTIRIRAEDSKGATGGRR